MTRDQLFKASEHVEAIRICERELDRWENFRAHGGMTEEAAALIKRLAMADLRETIARHEGELASL